MIAVVLRQEVHLLSAIHPGEYGCHPGEADAADAASVVRDWELPIDFAEVGAAPMDFRKRSPGESQ